MGKHRKKPVPPPRREAVSAVLTEQLNSDDLEQGKEKKQKTSETIFQRFSAPFEPLNTPNKYTSKDYAFPSNIVEEKMPSVPPQVISAPEGAKPTSPKRPRGGDEPETPPKSQKDQELIFRILGEHKPSLLQPIIGKRAQKKLRMTVSRRLLSVSRIRRTIPSEMCLESREK